MTTKIPSVLLHPAALAVPILTAALVAAWPALGAPPAPDPSPAATGLRPDPAPARSGGAGDRATTASASQVRTGATVAPAPRPAPEPTSPASMQATAKAASKPASKPKAAAPAKPAAPRRTTAPEPVASLGEARDGARLSPVAALGDVLREGGDDGVPLVAGLALAALVLASASLLSVVVRVAGRFA